MKKWEDIIKDKLEAYESELPEGALAEFQALRDAAPASRARWRYRVAWAVSLAVAAGLAAFLLLRPERTEDDIRLIPEPQGIQADFSGEDAADLGGADAAGVGVVPLSSLTAMLEPVGSKPGAGKADPTAADVKPDAGKADPAATDVKPGAGKTDPAVTDVKPDPAGGESAAVAEDPAAGGMPDEAASAAADRGESGTDVMLAVRGGTDENAASPYVGGRPAPPKTKMTVGTAAGIVTGGGLAAALGSALSYISGGGVDTGTDMGFVMSSPAYGLMTGRLEDRLLDTAHYFPMRTGLSARFPMTGNLYISTGLEYSMFASRFVRSLSGEKLQMAHYLGIPVRLDWVLASGRRFDVYLGGGFSGDICVGAVLDGEKIRKDAPSFSVLGAGGIQWNMTRRLGLYLEPELSWTVPSERHVLETYRTEDPLMFSLVAGLRFNFDAASPGSRRL